MYTPVLYFDTNVIRDISEERVAEAKKYATYISNLVEQRNLIIAPSIEVLYELLSAPDVCEEIRQKNARLYTGLANWKYAMKPSEQMLKDDISSWRCNDGPSTPYMVVDEANDFIQSIREGNLLFLPDEWKEIIEKSYRQNEQFVTSVFKKFVKKLPSGGKAKLRDFPEQTWKEWWACGGLAEVVAVDLAKAVTVDISCPTSKLSQRCSPLALPTIRAATGYLLHGWYQQIVNKARLKPTEHYDFRSAVLAGGIGNIVTEDRKLRNAIKHIPKLSVKTWTLKEFVEHLSNIYPP